MGNDNNKLDNSNENNIILNNKLNNNKLNNSNNENIPRIFADQDLIYQGEKENGEKREVRCYYNSMRFTSHGMDSEGDNMEGAGKCTTPHPDDELNFSKRWILRRQGVVRNAFVRVKVPEQWIDDETKWVRSQEKWDDYYN